MKYLLWRYHSTSNMYLGTDTDMSNNFLNKGILLNALDGFHGLTFLPKWQNLQYGSAYNTMDVELSFTTYGLIYYTIMPNFPKLS